MSHHDSLLRPAQTIPRPDSSEQDEFFARRHEERSILGGPVVRTFETGANRDVDHDKLDYEGFLSPSALERFGQYMHKNRFLRDNSIRDSDNWQKGIPFTVYMKSLVRHVFAAWKTHREIQRALHDTQVNQGAMLALEARLEEELCAIWFNTQGYLHELLKR